jgi:4-diphosphocytidyl-2-C-methyl-D-erythritol kinase
MTYGRGEIIKPAPSLPNCGIVIVVSKLGVSTPEQFAELDRIYNEFEGYKPNEDRLEALLTAISEKDIEGIGNNLYNIFEKTERCSLSVCEKMKELGAYGTLLSGSGSSIFGVFEDFEKAQKAAKKLDSLGFTAIACRPVQTLE